MGKHASFGEQLRDNTLRMYTANTIMLGPTPGELLAAEI